ncbi:DNA cross-link repair 1A protein-like [Amphibalanus amphitrite]|uniref:DNA cross-link repair 1A protein-like n=1 Tax=Amphibalanus amphitrite TaxID=1232801 RepID=UPI001C921517|nr:DNA cross-link repair 1A protein-like [Amphibalanus amphitrite]
MDDDRDVFLPPKKFRYKQLHHRGDPAGGDAADRARLPLKKTAVFRAAQEAALSAAAAAAPAPAPAAPSGSAAHPAQMSPALCYAPPDSAPVKLPYCPSCQMPFAILVSATPMHHLDECAQMGRSQQLPECPDSVHCQSGVPAHYSRYAHLALARLRAYQYQYQAHALLTSRAHSPHHQAPPPLPAALSPHVHRDVLQLRQPPGGYPIRSAAVSAPSSAVSASNLQLLSLARQLPGGAGSAAAPLRVTHSPHGSLHSPLSVSLGSPHPSPASTSPQAPSPLPPSAAPAPVPSALGRSSPSSEHFPIRSRANTMSPPRGGRGGRYGSRPRSCSFTLPQRPGSSASLSVPPRRAGFSIAEIMEPAAAAAETGGALDLSVRRRPAPFDDLQEDPQDTISECVSDAVERFLDDDSKLSGTAQDSGISEGNRGAASEAAKPSDSGSAGSKVTVSISSAGGISQPPKKRRLTLDQATAAACRQAAISACHPPAPAPTTTEKEDSTSAQASAAAATTEGTEKTTAAPTPVSASGTGETSTSAPTAAASGTGRIGEGSATAADTAQTDLGQEQQTSAAKPAPSAVSAKEEETKRQWAHIMSKMRPSAVTPAQQQRAQVNGERPPTGERKCPFYKLIPGAPFAVDAFNYGTVPGVEAYFLSHFHYDHYRGLSKAFPKTVYCGKVTGNLVLTRLKVPIDRIKMLPMNEPRLVFGVEVTLLDANHCPGAVMFLFKFKDGRAILHVGDFRADPAMESYPELWNTSIDRVYLDTTYCDPVYDFPSQSDILHQCVRIVTEAIQKHAKTLVVCGSYTIGKERVFLAIAEALDCLFWASADKRRTLQCLEERAIKRRLTTEQQRARIHVLPLGHLTMKTLQNYLKIFQSQYTHIVAIKPTGWEHGKDHEPHGDFKPKVSGNIAIYGVPYSEHSSYSELKRFVQFVQPREIIPTVNVGSAAARAQMDSIFRGWLSEGRPKPRSLPAPAAPAPAASAAAKASTQAPAVTTAAGSSG